MADLVSSVEELLERIPGVTAVRKVVRETVQSIVELESRFETQAFLPVKNVGVRAAVNREIVFAVLKDNDFREPPEPTVYLVEEVDSAGETSDWQIEVEDRSYNIVGEEVLASRKPYKERTVSLQDSFVLFPERRRDAKVPSYFLIPPLGFPELEAVQEKIGIRQIISISPSAQADTFLRQTCGFSMEPTFATLLVGFNSGTRGGIQAER